MGKWMYENFKAKQNPINLVKSVKKYYNVLK